MTLEEQETVKKFIESEKQRHIKNNTILYETIKTRQLTEEELKIAITYHSITTLLKHQKLTPEFCVKYILNEQYQTTVEEEYTDYYDVLFYQRHITKTELFDAIDKWG